VPDNANRTASTVRRGLPAKTVDLEHVETVLRNPGRQEGMDRMGSPWARRLRELLPYVAAGAIAGSVAFWAFNHYLFHYFR
jgi:hypothetical protein